MTVVFHPVVRIEFLVVSKRIDNLAFFIIVPYNYFTPYAVEIDYNKKINDTNIVIVFSKI